MSTASDIMSLIRLIADTSSRSEKERLVANLAADELGKFVLKWAYDPFITYGVKPAKPDKQGKLQVGFRETLVQPLLERLAQRKLTGNLAAVEIEETFQAFDKDGAELLWLILSKDLKCGIAETTINTVSPGLIPVFSVMRAHKFEEKRVKSWPQALEPKLDGFRVTFLCRDGNGGFFTRSGKRMPSLDYLVEDTIAVALKALTASNSQDLRFTLSTRPGDLARMAREDLNFMLDGEAMSGSFNETSGALRRESEQAKNAVYHIFDMMSYADFDADGSVGRPFKERRALVQEFVGYANGATDDADLSEVIKMTPLYLVNSAQEIHDYYGRFRARGLEGAMLKNLDGLYDKKKTYAWMKLKAEESEDLPIVGAYPGEPGTKYEHCLGGAIVKRANGVLVRVGGGWSDEEREELWKAYHEDLAELERNGATIDDPSFDGQPRFLIRLIEVMFHEETPDGSLRHPRKKRFRDDKAGEIEKKAA